MGGLRKIIKGAVLALSVAALGACAAQYRNHGYIPTEEDLQEVVVGVDTRASVAETVGAPSAGGVLNESGYYYVRTRVRHFAYQAPKVIDRQLVAISFNGRGVVTNVERFTLEDGNVVPLSRRITTTGIGDVSFLRQLMSNIGRFSASEFFRE